MRKIFTKTFMLLVVLMLSVSICTGCTSSLGGFFDTLKDIDNIDSKVESGEISINVTLDEDTQKEVKRHNINPYVLNDMSIAYTVATDSSSSQTSIKAVITVLGTTKPLTFNIDKEHVYVKTAELVDLLKVISTEDYETVYAKVFADCEWIDLADIDIDDDDMDSETMEKEVNKMVDAVVKAYASFSSTVATSSGNTYTISLDNMSTATLVKELFSYTKNNAESIKNILTQAIANSQFFVGDDKQYAIAELDYIASYLQNLTYEEENSIIEGIDTYSVAAPSFSAQFSVTKNKNSSYTKTGSFSLVSDDVTVKIKSESTVGKGDVKIGVFPEKVVSVQEIQNRIIKNPVSIKATLPLTSGNTASTLTVNKGYINGFEDFTADSFSQQEVIPRIIDNRTYLPLRAIAEACGENVNWDNVNKQAYVVVDGQKVVISGYVDTKLGKTYVKVKDFEKLGYTAQYDYDTKVVTLSK
jgi:hypothetical protein